MAGNAMNIEIVIKLLKANGIDQVVVSPGGANRPFVRAVQDDPFFHCYSVVDERSAIYFAIGIYLQTGKIVATSCTSAQATRNYIPGLTEAFYKRVPILAITTAKHARFSYQEYMQAPDQASLPNDCVKKSFSLPFINGEDDIFHSIRLVNEAIIELTSGGCGPVQLCIPSHELPAKQYEPKIRKIEKYGVEDEWSFDLSDKKVLLVIGEHSPVFDAKAAIDEFCEKCDVLVYTNHLSNFHNDYSLNANLAMTTISPDELEKSYLPDIMITIGGQTGDYPLFLKFSNARYSSVEHWRVCNDGKIIDTYDKLTKVFQCSESEFFKRCTGKKSSSHGFYETWANLVNAADLTVKLPFSNAYIAQSMHDRVPENSVIQLSILNSLRTWSFFPLKESVSCFSNVAAFGIDGGMSTLIGQSVVTDALCLMVIGDLAFFYDMNAIGIRHIKNNLRILLINNSGGVEFKLGNQDNEYTNKFISASGHFKNAKGWAQTCGFTYMSASSAEEFDKLRDSFLQDSPKPIILEAFISDVDEAKAYQAIIDGNTQMTLRRSLGKIVKGIIK